jgi:hypothetical protein
MPWKGENNSNMLDFPFKCGEPKSKPMMMMITGETDL